MARPNRSTLQGKNIGKKPDDFSGESFLRTFLEGFFAISHKLFGGLGSWTPIYSSRSRRRGSWWSWTTSFELYGKKFKNNDRADPSWSFQQTPCKNINFQKWAKKFLVSFFPHAGARPELFRRRRRQKKKRAREQERKLTYAAKKVFFPYGGSKTSKTSSNNNSSNSNSIIIISSSSEKDPEGWIDLG